MTETYKLRLYTDRLEPGAKSNELAATNRALYVAEGTAVVRGAGVTASLGVNTAWQGRAPVTVTAGPVTLCALEAPYAFTCCPEAVVYWL